MNFLPNSQACNDQFKVPSRCVCRLWKKSRIFVRLFRYVDELWRRDMLCVSASKMSLEVSINLPQSSCWRSMTLSSPCQLWKWKGDWCLTALHHTARAHQGNIVRPPYWVTTEVVQLRFKQPDPPICQISKDVASEVVESGFQKFIWYRVCEYCSRSSFPGPGPAIFERDVAMMGELIILKYVTVHLDVLRSIPQLRTEKPGAFRLTTGTYMTPCHYCSCLFAFLFALLM
jgi:hypothetical protein